MTLLVCSTFLPKAQSLYDQTYGSAVYIFLSASHEPQKVSYNTEEVFFPLYINKSNEILNSPLSLWISQLLSHFQSIVEYQENLTTIALPQHRE